MAPFAPPLIRIKTTSADAQCPNCKHKTLHYDFARDVAACPACGYGGGVVDTWAFLKGLHGSDARKQAAKEIQQWDLKISENNFKELKPKECKLASISKRNKVYSYLLANLQLEEKHRKNLIDRGLNESQIEEKGYKSLPKNRFFTDKDCSGVPGFYKENGKWYLVSLGSGFLIPERNSRGDIQGLQIRTDKGKTKYFTLSSTDKPEGTSSSAFCHLSNYYNEPLTEVILTEGPLKGDIINIKRKTPVLAIPGVSSQKNLTKALNELKKNGLKILFIAFDMDFYDKTSVQEALYKLRKKLSDMEIPYKQLIWDKTYKGLDDFMKSRTH